MKSLLLLCGGRSGEHEVSLASAKSVATALENQFNVTTLVIDKVGKLLSPQASLKALKSGESQLSTTRTSIQTFDIQTFNTNAVDVVFPLLHGPYGEDGTVQGFLRLLGLPFVGSDVLGSAVGMDKPMMKAVFEAHGLPQIPYQTVSRLRWQTEPKRVLESLEKLRYPLFVKPANLGSSVGISKATNLETLTNALDVAANYDRRIIVEQGVENVRELEVAVLGNDTPHASPVGEISYTSDFYDYETKYTEGHAKLQIPAAIPDALSERCRELALEAFKAIDAAGLARVDFFYDELADALYLNEINTMPGFTITSMYPKLWEAAGISYPELVSKLVELALEPR